MEVVEVYLGLRDDQPALPQQVKVPVKIMTETGLSRNVMITERDQVVPKVLRDWMLTQRDYAHWFKSGEAVVVTAENAVEEIPPEPVATEEDIVVVVETLDVTTDEADATVDDEPVIELDPEIEAMTVDQLKVYAEENDIDITGLTRKQEIKDAIYEYLYSV